MCELCTTSGGTVLLSTEKWRIVLVDDPNYPGFCRVIWTDHIAEMTDLSPHDQSALFEAVMATERALRAVLHPDKINLASLGNMTPHLHWHIIPRFKEDTHFPHPIWGTPQREAHPVFSEGWIARLKSALMSAKKD